MRDSEPDRTQTMMTEKIDRSNYRRARERDTNSPYPPMLTAQIPYPDPNSPYPPMLTAQIPYPDPNSPYPPMLTAQIPYPDPNSPYPPMLTAQIPYPDPNSPYPPNADSADSVSRSELALPTDV